MQCPNCNSENTQRLEVIYNAGTQEINTHSATAGGAHGGAFGIGGAVTKTSGQSQSLLAKQVAPPAKKSYKWPIIAILFGFFAFYSNSHNNLMGGLIIGLLLGGPGAYLCFSNFQYNSNKWPSLYQHWFESWMCSKCGSVYQI